MISPLYIHARQPYILDHDRSLVGGLKRPQIPSNINSLEPHARHAAEDLFLEQSLYSLYITISHYQNPRLFAALNFQETKSYFLLVLARMLLINGKATFITQVDKLEAIWTTLPRADGSSYLFSFSADNLQQIQTDAESAACDIVAISSIAEPLGELFPE